MTLDEYQDKAIRTALPTSLNVPYMTLGLAGEAGEIANKVKKIIRDDMHPNERLADLGVPEEKRQQLVQELGDVLWYCAGLAYVLGMDLEQVAEINVSKLASRKAAGTLGGSGDTR